MATFEEKAKHFYKRTNRHISLVKKYADRMCRSFPGLKQVALEHDRSKFEEPELFPYIDISWFYRCKGLGEEFKPKHSEDERKAATEHHLKHNEHHPEYWGDVTKMPPLYLAEMVADWCAMAEETSTDPREWAMKNIGVRWNFNPGQEKLIYKLLEMAWK
jgi:hypothetical protein